LSVAARVEAGAIHGSAIGTVEPLRLRVFYLPGGGANRAPGAHGTFDVGEPVCRGLDLLATLHDGHRRSGDVLLRQLGCDPVVDGISAPSCQ